MTKPKHIGIIMDGNGRWAQLRGRARAFGHIKGARTAKKIITAASDNGVKHLTLYAFSTENWLRPKEEVSFLMTLLRRYIAKEVKNLIKENVRFTVIGELHRLPSDLIAAIQNAIELTKHCTGLNLIFAISYGARNELVEATRQIANKVQQGKIQPSDINENLFAQHLFTHPAPDVDLIIRTSGEKRLSNFLLWQTAYSELSFTETLWPDFSTEEFVELINDFSKRDRRFGSVAKTKNQHENFSY